MFNTLAFFALFTLAAAAPHNSRTSPSSGSDSQCCMSVVQSTDPAISYLDALLGIDLSGLNVPIGLSCSPITVLGNNCGGTTVNCESPVEQTGGLININCIPIVL
ncbi:fungal hydrophobin [Mycena amicta]|nr:fungal hydrophobin [Mycena amicta]